MAVYDFLQANKRIAIFLLRYRASEKHRAKRHSNKKTNQESKSLKKRRNEREQDIYTKGTPGGIRRLGSRAKSRFLRRSRIKEQMADRKQCGFFERFRQRLEAEGAGAVWEAEQKEWSWGRDGGRRRRVTSSFVIVQTMADIIHFYVPEVARPHVEG